MLNSVRDVLLAGLGAAVITREKVMEVAQRWVEKGSMTAAEAERMADEIMEESRRQGQEVKNQLEEAVSAALGRMDLARNSQVTGLDERVAELERRVAELEGGRAADPTAAPGPASDQMPDES